jgi:hypothetical protein
VCLPDPTWRLGLIPRACVEQGQASMSVASRSWHGSTRPRQPRETSLGLRTFSDPVGRPLSQAAAVFAVLVGMMPPATDPPSFGEASVKFRFMSWNVGAQGQCPMRTSCVNSSPLLTITLRINPTPRASLLMVRPNVLCIRTHLTVSAGMLPTWRRLGQLLPALEGRRGCLPDRGVTVRRHRDAEGRSGRGSSQRRECPRGSPPDRRFGIGH